MVRLQVSEVFYTFTMKCTNSSWMYRSLNAAIVLGTGCFVLPYLRDYVLLKLQPILMRRHHKVVRDLKVKLFKFLHDYKDTHIQLNSYIRVLEIGAASGSTLEDYPYHTQLVVVEPVAGFRGAFDKHLKLVNEISGQADGDQVHSKFRLPVIRLEAWYTMTAEELLNPIQATATGSAEVSRPELVGGTFDAFISTFTLCTVRDVEKVLNNATQLVKPDGLLILLEHIKPPGPLWSLLCSVVQPIWGFVFGGCHLSRRPDRLLLSNPELKRCWQIIFCEEHEYGGLISMCPVRNTLGLIARRLAE
ncbi:hypothetical protein EG68_03882 [Paragonimus skrjabini miyazakii]|uniref:Methyltransferase type 11 domain-containing protein n=1 Tax=Paragonimus skrjabini miyazakii TaxID=59628 RepID=A0A8S9Z159_9TREM|nr:hypothetical protein EG68_03882 [Paragonimus skrjabini miyazakii]